jgi:hypothetical protein
LAACSPSSTSAGIVPEEISLSTPEIGTDKSNNNSAEDMISIPPTSTPSETSGSLGENQSEELGPWDWMLAPVIPVPSDRIKEIYTQGLAKGNNPRAFSKIGDSETFTSWFLMPFDGPPRGYNLGEFSELDEVIQHFQGSYARQSLAARKGFTASSVFAPLWADPSQCDPGETPIACEFRIHRPAYVLILLGTNDYLHVDKFEDLMRRMIEFSIDNGVIPILGTKADNLEGDHSINRTLFELAVEYEIPLWNFWVTVQDLPEQGLDDDGAHLTFGRNDFSDPEAMQRAWPLRNLTALQTLDTVWRSVAQP